MENIEQQPEYSSKDRAFLDEMAEKFGVKSPQYKKFLKAVEEDRAAKNMGLGNRLEKEKVLLTMVKEMLRQIDTISLEKPNKRTAKLLAQQKLVAKKEIRNLLEYARRYTDALDRVNKVYFKKKDISPEDYRSAYEEVDALRRRSHDALYDQLGLVSRYIRLHFGQLSDSQLEKFEESEDDAGREVLDVVRQKLPDNLLWPKGVNLNDRNSLADWAILITRELADVALEDL